MEENKKIKDLIGGLTHIDFTKRYDYNKINSYFNKTPITNNYIEDDNIKFFLPYFHFTRKHILNIILNSFSWFFLFSVSLELLNEFNLNKNSSIFLTMF